ncbi:MAG: hypothetical protein FWC46_02210 [Actinomycetia bacterium]|nr:hypothetical protein [Actinomycetes bacterium]
MRTTVNIPDGLLEQAKRLAREDGTSVGEVLAISLQHYLANLERPARPPLVIPTFPCAFVAPVDPSSNKEIFDYLDMIEEQERAGRDRS